MGCAPASSRDLYIERASGELYSGKRIVACLNWITDSMWAIDMIVNFTSVWRTRSFYVATKQNATETTLRIPLVGVLLKILLVYMHNSLKGNVPMEKFNIIPDGPAYSVLKYSVELETATFVTWMYVVTIL